MSLLDHIGSCKVTKINQGQNKSKSFSCPMETCTPLYSSAQFLEYSLPVFAEVKNSQSGLTSEHVVSEGRDSVSIELQYFQAYLFIQQLAWNGTQFIVGQVQFLE